MRPGYAVEMRRVGILLAIAACSSSTTPAAAVDAPDSCAATANARPTLVHATVSSIQTGNQATITFPAIANDDLLSFLIVQGAGAHQSFVALSTTDGIAPYAPSYVDECGKAVAFFGALGPEPDLTSVTFNISEPGPVQIFAFEFASPDRAMWPGSTLYGSSNSASAIASAAPSMDVCPNDIVISAVVGCGDLGSLMPDSGFVTVGGDNSGVAYAIPEVRLPYQARWSSTGGSWAGFSAQYRTPHTQ